MFARSRPLRLSNGVHLETPVLAPGLSSIATGPLLFAGAPDGEPELTVCSIVHSEMLTLALDDEVLLISAHDIARGLLADYSSLYSGFRTSRWARPRFLLIDSGWYEKVGSPVGGAFVEGLDPHALAPWEETDAPSRREVTIP